VTRSPTVCWVFLRLFAWLMEGTVAGDFVPPTIDCKGQPLLEPGADILDKGGLEAAKGPNFPQTKLVWVPPAAQQVHRPAWPWEAIPAFSQCPRVSPQLAQGVPRQVPSGASNVPSPSSASLLSIFPFFFFSRNELLLHLKTYNIYYEGQNLQLRHREVSKPRGRHPAYLWQERKKRTRGNWV